MKYTIKTRSWHFWVACFLNDELSVLNKKTICSYRWSVIFGFVRMLLMIGIAVLAFFLPLSVAILHHFLPKEWSSTAVFVCDLIVGIEVAVVVLVFLGVQLHHWNQAYQERKTAEELEARLNGTFKEKRVPKKDKEPKQPGFLITAWRSMKDKYCLPIDFSKDP